MQAIRTKYISATNTKGSRIQASCETKTIYVPYNHALSLDGNHRAACERLMRAMEWTSDYGRAYTEMTGGWYGGAMYWAFQSDWNHTNVNGTNAQVAA